MSASPKLRVSVFVMVGVLILIGAAIGGVVLYTRLALPAYSKPDHVVYLEQNWTPAQRNVYYHTPQGSVLLPYEWFKAMEQPKFSLTGAPKFSDAEYLSRFGFLEDGKSPANPDGLPVGFTVDTTYADPNTNVKRPVLGLTCAACHTGEVRYKGNSVRIDGGAGQADFAKFQQALGLGLAWTYYDPLRFGRFAHAVLQDKYSKESEAALKTDVKQFLDAGLLETEGDLRGKIYPVAEGPGRTDALARIGNYVFGTELQNQANKQPATAPVNFPPIWDASWLDWVQYNGSITQPLGRNVGEAMGVMSPVVMSAADPEKQFDSSINVLNLEKIEEALAGAGPGKGLRSPQWPEEVLGKIDREQAAEGHAVFVERCERCHGTPLYQEGSFTGQRWYKPYAGGPALFRVTSIPLKVIGTDPNEATNFNERKADSGPLGLGVVSAAEGLEVLGGKVIAKSFARLGVPAEQQTAMEGGRPNKVIAPLAYKARPLNGIWSSPPFLHNGSVPNLYLLLSPVEERPKQFYVGGREYDPENVGIKGNYVSGGFLFDTTKQGNSNQGHEFSDKSKPGVIGPALTPEQRRAIVEYMKTL
ncbi:MAG: di-heme-cytochrome C peroxidase [Acidobacteriaceae bacterium]